MLDARAIAFLQNRLGLAPTGLPDGGTTEATLRAWQARNGLKADGIYGPLTNKAMTGRTAGTLELIAKDYGLDAKAFAAIVQVETTGAGFLDDGRPKILLERHYVYRQATQAERNALPADLCYPTPGGYKGGAAEWDRFETVAQVSLDLAIQSCSWGLGQIMGANWKTIGEVSAQKMMWRAAIDEFKQLTQMGAFILTKPGLKTALNAHDWATVARIYNGPAQQGYDTKLAAAFKALA